MVNSVCRSDAQRDDATTPWNALWMSFTDEIFKIPLFLPEGVKIDFENTERVSDVKAVQ
jgi:hypothetical protein